MRADAAGIWRKSRPRCSWGDVKLLESRGNVAAVPIWCTAWTNSAAGQCTGGSMPHGRWGDFCTDSVPIRLRTIFFRLAPSRVGTEFFFAWMSSLFSWSPPLVAFGDSVRVLVGSDWILTAGLLLLQVFFSNQNPPLLPPVLCLFKIPL